MRKIQEGHMLGRRKNAGNESRRFVHWPFFPVSVKTQASWPLPLEWFSGKCGHHYFHTTAPAGQSLYWLISLGPTLDSFVRKRKAVRINNWGIMNTSPVGNSSFITHLPWEMGNVKFQLQSTDEKSIKVDFILLQSKIGIASVSCLYSDCWQTGPLWPPFKELKTLIASSPD